MTDNKKRILFVGEASSLSTGFSTYYRELIPRLVETGKYEIAELGCYVDRNHGPTKEFVNNRWKFYPGMPSTEAEKKLFEESNTHPQQPGQQLSQFGAWCFDSVVADFQPDIVIDIRDWWMLAFQSRSALRQYFQWIVMPTVDSIPQREEWINTYLTADYVAAYSDFGIDSLRKSNPHLELRFDPPNVNVLGSNSLEITKMPGKLHPVPLRPGVDIKTFKPMDKGQIREKWGLNPENPVIVIVQRNQARKRINEALSAFAYMKEKYKGNKAIDKAVMLLHTAFPDNMHSSDYPRCIERIHKGYHGVPYTHKNMFAEVLNTFICTNSQCGKRFLGHAIHLRRVGPQTNYMMECPHCKQISARPPNTGFGYSREELAEVYAMGDILLQMSIAEGCGMPVQEAKACGTMVLATDYAALSEKTHIPDYEHISKKHYGIHNGGDRLEVSYLYEEAETNCWRAHTSIEHAGDQMAKYLMNEELLREMQAKARKCAEDHYDWDQLATQWEFILDKKKVNDRANTWDKPAALIKIDTSRPDINMQDDEFVDWCYTQLLGYSPSEIDAKGKNDWIQTIDLLQQRGASREDARCKVMDFFRGEATKLNQIEILRTQSQSTNDTVAANQEPKKQTVRAVMIQ